MPPLNTYNRRQGVVDANFCRIESRFTFWRRGGAGVAGTAAGRSHEERFPAPEPARMDVCSPRGLAGRYWLPAWLPAGPGDSRGTESDRARNHARLEAQLEVLPRRRGDRALAAH